VSPADFTAGDAGHEGRPAADRVHSPSNALLAQAEAELREVEEVLVDLARALAESEPSRLVHRLLDAIRRVAGASFGLFVPEDGGTTLALSARGPEDLEFKEPPLLDEAPLLAGALDAGEVLIVDDLFRWARTDEAQVPYGRLEDGSVVRSWLVLPVEADEAGSHGAIVLGHPDPHRFDHRRERRAIGLGQHLAGALDRAEAERQRSQVGQALQSVLLPPGMPDVPGMGLAARYRAAGASNVVGGDFYDVFGIEGDAWAVILGDVSGFGPEAAAITGQARYTVRAVAATEPTPSGVLRRLNDAIGGRNDDRFCTAVYLRMEPGEGGVDLCLSRGGHPPPLVLREGGQVEALDGAAGLPLGMFPDAEVSDIPCTLQPGDAIVLYTDGVIEARDATGDQFGQARLEALLATCAGRTADGIARRIELAAMDFQGDTASDDVAIVVVRADPTQGGRTTPPATPT
jgi:serine phosphatase RsbU (regulator of sigma subunit)